MKLGYLMLLTFASQLSWSAVSGQKNVCMDIYGKNYMHKEISLLSFYESKSLCGYNTEGKMENGGMIGVGKWLTIISKDPKKAIIDGPQSETDTCAHSSPIDSIYHCPPGKKFEEVAKYKKEEFKFINLKH